MVYSAIRKAGKGDRNLSELAVFIKVYLTFICLITAKKNPPKSPPSCSVLTLQKGFVTLFDMGFFEPSVMGGGGGVGEGPPS